jgi:hypothetical protein
MKIDLRVLAIVPVLFLTSCVIQTFDNPIDAPPGTGVDASAFLGTWHLVSVGAYVPTNQLVLKVISQAGGSIVATVVTSAKSNDQTVVLSTINGKTLASVQAGPNSWEIFAISTNTQGKLILSSPDVSVLSNDVKNATLSGDVQSLDRDGGTIHITASSSQLRTYFSSRTSMFLDSLTFQKQ